MKKTTSIIIIILLIFSFVYSDNNDTDSQEKNKENKYWAKGAVYILNYKNMKGKVKIKFAMKNKSGNIPIKSYKIKFLIVYKGGVEEYHVYRFTEPRYLAPYLKRIQKCEFSTKYKKEIEGVFVEKLEYELLDEKEVWKYTLNRNFLVVAFTCWLIVVSWYIKEVVGSGF